MDLTQWDVIAVSTSAGKDSQAMLDVVVELADAQGVSRDKIVCIHADLGRVEWQGTAELAQDHAEAYGLHFIKIKRPQGDLLDHIEQRGMFPSSAARYCTSDHKRGQINKVFTALTKEIQEARGNKERVRILSCIGYRRQESPARAKKVEVTPNVRASNGKREIVEWYPILEWTSLDVFTRCAQAPTELHPAYELGMPRLSCVFCVLASKSALLIAARHNPELADEYVRVERKIGHTFQNGRSIESIVEEARSMDDEDFESFNILDWAA